MPLAGHAARVILMSCFGGTIMRSLRFAIVQRESLFPQMQIELPAMQGEPGNAWSMTTGVMPRMHDESMSPGKKLLDAQALWTSIPTRDHLTFAVREAIVSCMSINRGSDLYWMTGALLAALFLCISAKMTRALIGSRFRFILRDGSVDTPCRFEISRVDVAPHTGADKPYRAQLICDGLREWQAVAMARRHLISFMDIASMSSGILVVNI